MDNKDEKDEKGEEPEKSVNVILKMVVGVTIWALFVVFLANTFTVVHKETLSSDALAIRATILYAAFIVSIALFVGATIIASVIAEK